MNSALIRGKESRQHTRSDSKHSFRSRSRDTESRGRNHFDSDKKYPRQSSSGENGGWWNNSNHAREGHSSHEYSNVHKERNSKQLTGEEEFLESRRREREIIGSRACQNIWGMSPRPDE